MIALEIKNTKYFMNLMLASSKFDNLLVDEAVITTFNTFTIDGRTVKDFYSAEELEELTSSCSLAEFSSWKDIRPVCFDLIKGKKAPVSFKVVFLASQSLIGKITSDSECQVAENLIRSLVLNIRYDNGKVTCISGTSFNTFVMDKSVEKLWDSYVKQIFGGLDLDFEEI